MLPTCGFVEASSALSMDSSWVYQHLDRLDSLEQCTDLSIAPWICESSPSALAIVDSAYVQMSSGMWSRQM